MLSIYIKKTSTLEILWKEGKQLRVDYIEVYLKI